MPRRTLKGVARTEEGEEAAEEAAEEVAEEAEEAKEEGAALALPGAAREAAEG